GLVAANVEDRTDDCRADRAGDDLERSSRIGFHIEEGLSFDKSHLPAAPGKGNRDCTRASQSYRAAVSKLDRAKLGSRGEIVGLQPYKHPRRDDEKDQSDRGHAETSHHPSSLLSENEASSPPRSKGAGRRSVSPARDKAQPPVGVLRWHRFRQTKQ